MIDATDTASVGGNDIPPSYEEALEMPQPLSFSDDSFEALEGAVGGVGISDQASRGMAADRTTGARTSKTGSVDDVIVSVDDQNDQKNSSTSVPLSHQVRDLTDASLDEPPNYLNIGGRLEFIEAVASECLEGDSNPRD